MVAACLDGAAVPAGLVEFVDRHSDGNPFLVEELLAGLVAAGRPARVTDGRVGDRRARSPRRCRPASALRSSAASTRSIRPPAGCWRPPACSGGIFEWELLPGIADVDGRAAVDALRAAVDEQLIEVDGDGFRFRHALDAGGGPRRPAAAGTA